MRHGTHHLSVIPGESQSIAPTSEKAPEQSEAMEQWTRLRRNDEGVPSREPLQARLFRHPPKLFSHRTSRNAEAGLHESRSSGKVALVTGAAGGIGLAIARLFAASGAAVVIADIDGERAAAAADDLPRTISVEMDIRDQAAVARGLTQALAAFGRVDILVNNAGVNTLAHRVDIDAFPPEEAAHRRHRSDGTYLVSRTVAQAMIRERSGRIINIA
jgi:hypothetical protein